MEHERSLDHVPQLVKAYGRWPSFAYLVFAVAARPVAAGLLLLALYRLWH